MQNLLNYGKAIANKEKPLSKILIMCVSIEAIFLVDPFVDVKYKSSREDSLTIKSASKLVTLFMVSCVGVKETFLIKAIAAMAAMIWFGADMEPLVDIDVASLGKKSVAKFAFIWSLSGMDPFVCFQVDEVAKSLTAMATFVGGRRRVRLAMGVHGAHLRKCLSTMATPKRLVAEVASPMRLQDALPLERFVALETFEGPDTDDVDRPLMNIEIGLLSESHVTLTALEWAFASVHSFVFQTSGRRLGAFVAKATQAALFQLVMEST